MALRRISALFLVILFLSGFSGCGKIGPLYLSDESEVSKEEPVQKIIDDKPEMQQE
ncbi:MAG: lipoprotein [Gammaproteobacteria bacterium]|nr:lipoprotein [Gammaproteobacteria bacterium]